MAVAGAARCHHTLTAMMRRPVTTDDGEARVWQHPHRALPRVASNWRRSRVWGSDVHRPQPNHGDLCPGNAWPFTAKVHAECEHLLTSTACAGVCAGQGARSDAVTPRLLARHCEQPVLGAWDCGACERQAGRGAVPRGCAGAGHRAVATRECCTVAAARNHAVLVHATPRQYVVRHLTLGGCVVPQTAVELSVFNMLSFMHEIETGKPYTMHSKNAVYSGLGYFDEKRKAKAEAEAEAKADGNSDAQAAGDASQEAAADAAETKQSAGDDSKGEEETKGTEGTKNSQEEGDDTQPPPLEPVGTKHEDGGAGDASASAAVPPPKPQPLAPGVPAPSAEVLAERQRQKEIQAAAKAAR